MLAAAAIALAILIALGVWQLYRLQWKTHLLAQIDAAEKAPPIPLSAQETPKPFTKVTASGTLGPEAALYGAEVRTLPNGMPKMGGQLVEILHRQNARPLLVDLGWVPEGATPIEGPASITGYARPADRPGLLSAADDIAGKHFYTLNPASIGTALHVADVAPFTLVAMGTAPAGAPEPATSLPRPPNNHLQYALTWFGLAAALIFITARFVATARGKLPRGGRTSGGTTS